MPEYIEKDKLLDTLHQCLHVANRLGKQNDANIYASAISLVDEQPAADVAIVGHGNWVDNMHCSMCGEPVPRDLYGDIILAKFCHGCGSAMDEEATT